MKNIIFDLGGVVLSRDKNLCSSDLTEFLNIIHAMPTPLFWLEFDRGTLTWEQTVESIAQIMQKPYNHCDTILREAIEKTRPLAATSQLVGRLKERGYGLYVLSNMSFAFINNFRSKYQILKQFDGEIISCEYKLIKPERAIYELISNKFSLNPAETLFIDDKSINTEAAAAYGFNVYTFDRNNPEKSCADLEAMLL